LISRRAKKIHCVIFFGGVFFGYHNFPDISSGFHSSNFFSLFSIFWTGGKKFFEFKFFNFVSG
jgi:hypothetical protein